METYLSRSSAVNPAGARIDPFDAWHAFIAPGDVFRHPREVLSHPGLAHGDKRAILASWASDAYAVENAPGMRCLVGNRAEPVSVDAVLAALGELDRMSPRMTATAKPTRPAPRRLRRFTDLHRYVRTGRRDDDDPPPCPVMAMPRPKTPPDASLATAIPA